MNLVPDLYKCDDCGLVMETVLGAADAPILCGETPLKKVMLKAEDKGLEKHLPVIEKAPGGYLVKVGSVAHPMEEKHYIVWIELRAEDVVMRKYLKPGQAPEAFFPIEAEHVTATEHCNVHGIWMAKN